MTIILNGTTGITTPGITNQGVVEFTAGSVSAPSITTTGDTNTGIYFPAADTIAFTEGGVESMRIDSSGNVGIGTASPTSKLHVVGDGNFTRATATDTFIQASNSVATFNITQSANGSTYLYNYGAYNLYFGTNSATRMTLDSSGNLGIGTASPNTGLVPGLVIGNGTDNKGLTFFGTVTTQQNIAFTDTANTQQGLIQYDHGSDYMRFFTSGNERARIDSSGNLGIGTTSPSFASGMGIAINGGAGQSRLALKNNNTGDASTDGLQIGVATDSSAFIEQRENSYLYFATNATERARITATGDFLVGTTTAQTNPGGAAVNATFNSGIVCGSATRSALINDRINFNGSQFYVLNESNSGVRLDNGATSWAAQSDERTKVIIEPIVNAIEKVSALRSVIGRYKTDEENARRSFLIAQDVQAVLPEAVSEDKDEAKTLSLRYTEVIPLLAAAIKELSAKVTALESK